jgi:hypothetical protein
MPHTHVTVGQHARPASIFGFAVSDVVPFEKGGDPDAVGGGRPADIALRFYS